MSYRPDSGRIDVPSEREKAERMIDAFIDSDRSLATRRNSPDVVKARAELIQLWLGGRGEK